MPEPKAQKHAAAQRAAEFNSVLLLVPHQLMTVAGCQPPVVACWVAGLDSGRRLRKQKKERTLDSFRYFKAEFLVKRDCFCVGHLCVNRGSRHKTSEKTVRTQVTHVPARANILGRALGQRQPCLKRTAERC